MSDEKKFDEAQLPPTPDQQGDPPLLLPPSSGPPRREVPKAALIVNQTVIHRPIGKQAQEVVSHADGSFSRLLDTDEQSYIRKIEVGRDWQPVDFGWLADKPISQICVLNDEGQFSGGIPTPEVRASTLARVIEISLLATPPIADLTFARVRPYESCRFEPAPDAAYMMRCPNGPAKATVAAVPGD